MKNQTCQKKIIINIVKQNVFSVFLFVWLRTHRDCDDDIGFCLGVCSHEKGYVISTKDDSHNHTKRVFEVLVISVWEK